MTIAVVDESGNIRKSEDVQAVDMLLKLRETKPFWEVVEGVVSYWMKKDKSRWESYILHLDAVKKDQKQTRVGNSQWRGVSRADGIERSLVVDFPVWIDMCLRVLYKGDSVEFNQEFYREFAHRFPVFRIREKV
jgi:hypothetical protein